MRYIAVLLILVLASCSSKYSIVLSDCLNPSLCAENYAIKLEKEGSDSIIVISDWGVGVDSSTYFDVYLIYNRDGGTYATVFYPDNNYGVEMKNRKKYKTIDQLLSPEQTGEMFKSINAFKSTDPCSNVKDYSFEGIFLEFHGAMSDSTVLLPGTHLIGNPSCNRVQQGLSLVRHVRSLKPELMLSN